MKFSQITLVISLILGISSGVQAQEDLGKSTVAMAYVCWQLANDSGREDDSDLFAKAISMMRKLPEFTSQKHMEYMGYAAKQTLKMDSEEREDIYNYACLEPLRNIKRANEQGMLD